MKAYYIILLALLAVSSNAYTQRKKKESKKVVTSEQTVKPDNVDFEKEKSNVNISVYQHIPYCGGAYPDEDQLNNSHPMTNTDFVLINLKDSSKTIVKTNASGTLELNLPSGNYAIQETFKNCSFEEFQLKNPVIKTGDYFQIGDEECYKTWWSSYLGTFTVVSHENGKSLIFTLYSACFTGNNPCLYYNGPYPP